MATIYFRNKNYDVGILKKLVTQGRLENVPILQISDLISAKAHPEQLAFKVDNTYHMLLGCKDNTNPNQPIRIITKFVLAKAEVEPTNHDDRRSENNYNSYQYNNPRAAYNGHSGYR